MPPSPSSPQRNYYEVLGLPRTTALADIKKRYRELARQHHPDVNRDKPAAAKIFAEISAAYKTLSDPDARAVYDAELSLRDSRAAAAAARMAARDPFGPPRPGGPAPPRPSSAPPPRAGAPPQQPSSGADIARLLAEAQAAFVRMKFPETRLLCEQVLRRDRRGPQAAQAYEILGDVFRMQNKNDDALNMYTMALQLNPRNQIVMQRVERLSRTGSGGGASAQRVFYDNRAAGMSPPPPPPFSSSARRPNGAAGWNNAALERRPLGVLLAGVFGYGLSFLLILFAALTVQPKTNAPAVFPGPVDTWSVGIVTIMALVGLTLGFTMTVTSAVRRVEDELILPGARTGGGAHLPLGLVLIVLSAVSFYAAALLYGVIGFLQESLTPSMVRVFGAVVVVVLLLAAIYEPGRDQMLLFGGNVVFLALLVGWFLGDFFRPDGF